MHTYTNTYIYIGQSEGQWSPCHFGTASALVIAYLYDFGEVQYSISTALEITHSECESLLYLTA